MTCDHLVWGTADLSTGMDYLEQQTGIRPQYGGSHPGKGTHNALLRLGGHQYLEILAPDPGQPDHNPWMGMGGLQSPALIRWAVGTKDIADCVRIWVGEDLTPGKLSPGKRKLPDGSMLKWTLSDPDANTDNILIPFLIDWHGGPHPASGLPEGCWLSELTGIHPQATEISALLQSVDISLRVVHGSDICLKAYIEGPKGRFCLE